MIRVLIITSILPIDQVAGKKNENDILIVTENKICEHYEDIEFAYLYTQTYANGLLGLFSKKWKEYSQITKSKQIVVRNRRITIFPVFQLPKKVSFRNFLLRISFIFYGNRLKGQIEKFQPNVIHTQDADGGAFIARFIKKKYGIPYIATLRGINHCQDGKIRHNLRDANELLAISPTQQRDLNKMMNRKSVLIPHGIESKFFQKKDSFYSNGKLSLIVIGRLLRLKNIPIILKAISKINNVTFDIIGDGPEKASLRQLVKQYGVEDRVFFHGQMSHSDIIDVLPQYDLFAMPSFPETLGRVYFEAMASGLPVLASKNTGIDGIITDGKEGFLIDHQSENEIALALQKVIDNPPILKEMGQNAQNLARRYDWNAISDKYYKLYSSLGNKDEYSYFP